MRRSVWLVCVIVASTGVCAMPQRQNAAAEAAMNEEPTAVDIMVLPSPAATVAISNHALNADDDEKNPDVAPSTLVDQLAKDGFNTIDIHAEESKMNEDYTTVTDDDGMSMEQQLSNAVSRMNSANDLNGNERADGGDMENAAAQMVQVPIHAPAPAKVISNVRSPVYTLPALSQMDSVIVHESVGDAPEEIDADGVMNGEVLDSQSVQAMNSLSTHMTMPGTSMENPGEPNAFDTMNALKSVSSASVIRPVEKAPAQPEFVPALPSVKVSKPADQVATALVMPSKTSGIVMSEGSPSKVLEIDTTILNDKNDGLVMSEGESLASGSMPTVVPVVMSEGNNAKVLEIDTSVGENGGMVMTEGDAPTVKKVGSVSIQNDPPKKNSLPIMDEVMKMANVDDFAMGSPITSRSVAQPTGSDGGGFMDATPPADAVNVQMNSVKKGVDMMSTVASFVQEDADTKPSENVPLQTSELMQSSPAVVKKALEPVGVEMVFD